jgi:hypothetical protein
VPLAALSHVPDSTAVSDAPNNAKVARTATDVQVVRNASGSASNETRTITKGPMTLTTHAVAPGPAIRAGDEYLPQDLAPSPVPPVPPAPPRTAVVGPNGVVISAGGSTISIASRRGSADRGVDRAVALKALGASHGYAASLRRADPSLRIDTDSLIELKALGIDADYIRSMASVGYTRLDAGELVRARALGVSARYIQAMSKAGYGKLPLEKLIELKAVGITSDDVARHRSANGRLPDIDRLVEMKALGINPGHLDPDDEHLPNRRH